MAALAVWLCAVLSAGAAARAQSAHPTVRGPYSGTVVSLADGAPISGAAVVLLWNHLDGPAPSLRLAGALETFTDQRGRFRFDTEDIERFLPSDDRPPTIVVFRPTFTAFPAYSPETRFGAPAAPFATPGAVVRLRPVTDDEDRSEALNTFVGTLSAAQAFPGSELPRAFDMIRRELTELGVVLPERPRP